MRFHPSLLSGAFLGAVALVPILAAAPTASSSTELGPSPFGVRVAEAVASDPVQVSAHYGTLRSHRTSEVGFADPGRMVELTARAGRVVDRGEVLARLDARPFAHALAAADGELARIGAELDQARRDAARAQRLASQDAMIAQQAEAMASRVTVLSAALRATRAARDDASRRRDEAVLRAPFSGVITDVFVEEGEVVAAGQPVVGLAGQDGLEVEIGVSAEVAAAATSVTALTVTAPEGGDASRTARLVRASSAASSHSGLYAWVLEVDEPEGWLPGMAVRVDVAREAAPGVVVPPAAIRHTSTRGPAVYRVREGRAEQVPVRTVSLLGDGVVVHGPLTPGDAVVTRGHDRILDGDAVEVTP